MKNHLEAEREDRVVFVKCSKALSKKALRSIRLEARMTESARRIKRPEPSSMGKWREASTWEIPTVKYIYTAWPTWPMPGSAWDAEAIVPAQLSFLTLYNPSLGRTDETLHNQVLYYYSSKSTRRKLRKSSDGDAGAQEHEERNERLRQIGLAQGMVEFAKFDTSTQSSVAIMD
jgi:hypothetical protein